MGAFFVLVSLQVPGNAPEKRSQLLKCYCEFINKFRVIKSKAHFQHFIYELYIKDFRGFSGGTPTIKATEPKFSVHEIAAKLSHRKLF